MRNIMKNIKNKRIAILLSVLLISMVITVGCSNTTTLVSEFEGKELFTYINDNNSLVIESTDGQIKKTIIEGKANEKMIDYDVCWEEQKVAYIVQSVGSADNEEFFTELRLYNLQDDTEAVLHHDDWMIRGVEWSPNKEYILMDIGTGAIGSLSLYSIATSDWIKIQDGVFDYSWSPNGEQIALSVREEVNPQTPVDDGSSFTTVVLNLKKENTIQTIMTGTTNFYVSPVTWGDDNTLYIEKRIFGEEQPIYYKVNVTDNKLVEIDAKELPNQNDSSSYPEEVREVLHEVSPDGTKVLYVKYSEADEKLKVMLWDATSQVKTELGFGEMPKWVN